MCLAVPGKLLSVEGDDPAFRTGRVDFGGELRTVHLVYTPDAAPGDFLLVHVGFALARVEAEEARRIYQSLEEIGALAEEEPVADEVLNAAGLG